MLRTARLLPALALLGGGLLVAPALAQAPSTPALPLFPLTGSVGLPRPSWQSSALLPAPEPAPEAVKLVDTVSGPDFLKDLPRPADQPRSLFQQPSIPVPPGPPLEGPYFQPDPLLDPPALPAPGCFFNADVAFETVHVKNRLVNSVTVAGRNDTIQLESAALDWTVSPRFEVGYRLPAGFGEFSLGYRFLATEGSSTFPGPDGLGNLRSRFDMNVFDFDYGSREMSLWPHAQMKWRFGIRLAYLYFDSQGTEPFAVAAAGSGMFDTRTSNSYVGAGPHASVEINHRLDEMKCGLEGTGLALFAKADFTTLLGRIRQGFFETSTTLGPDGQLLSGETRISSSTTVPTASGQLGLSWEPFRNRRFFAGYVFEQWWNTGRLSLSQSRGELFNQGVFLRGEFDF